MFASALLPKCAAKILIINDICKYLCIFLHFLCVFLHTYQRLQYAGSPTARSSHAGCNPCGAPNGAGGAPCVQSGARCRPPLGGRVSAGYSASRPAACARPPLCDGLPPAPVTQKGSPPRDNAPPSDGVGGAGVAAPQGDPPARSSTPRPRTRAA